MGLLVELRNRGIRVRGGEGGKHTAFNSPKLPLFAKCALRLALAEPAATPHKARSAADALSRLTRSGFGRAGDRQSRIMAASLRISATRRQRLHSGSRERPRRAAKRIVATRPVESWRTERRRAVVGEAVASPTPTPGEGLVRVVRGGSGGYLRGRRGRR